MNKLFHGLVLVDKPTGITSHDVVARLRRILGTKSVGHSGTLDPLASGLMACLVNEGTKLSQYILEGDKAYRVRAQFGITTDTLDTTGTVLSTKPVEITLAQVEKAMGGLMGEFEFSVPIFSAMKVDGKKLYEYAREEKLVEIPKKIMKFYDVKMLECNVEQFYADFEIYCSKGSFIRTWVDELGKSLGCGATMSALRRTFSNPYRVEQALTLENLEVQIRQSGNSGNGFVPMQEALPHAKRLRIKGQDQVLLSNGQISHDLRCLLIGAYSLDAPESIFQIVSQESDLVLALIGLDPVRGFVIRRVFNYIAL